MVRNMLALGIAVAISAEGLGWAASMPDEFFRPVEPVEAKLPADQVYPQGRVFPFTFFSLGGGSVAKRGELLSEAEVQAAFQRAKAAGVTMAGGQYELNDRLPKDARQHGMKALYTITGGFTKEEVESGKLTDEQIAKGIREQVAAVMDDDAIAWWYVQPEELRHWRPAEMRYLDVAARTIRETDPKKRPVWMYEPNHRNAKSLEQTVRYLDLLGKGMYTNYANMKTNRVWCRWTIEQEVEAIAAAKSKAVPLAVPEMFQQPAPEELALIPAWVRHDVYAALVAGAKGVVVFSASQRPKFEAHEAYFAAYLDAARELCGAMNLGQVFLFGERRNDLQVEVTQGPQKVSMVFPSGGVKEPIEYPSLSWANIAHANRRYLIAVNSTGEAVTAKVTGLPAGARVEDLMQAGQPPVSAGALTLEFGPWGVRALRLSPAP